MIFSGWAISLVAAGVEGARAPGAATIATYAEAGADRIYLQVLDIDDHDHLRLVADEVMALLP